MVHSRLSDPEYINWVTVGRAIQITRNGLVNIVQNAVDKYHTSLLATLPKHVKKWRSYLNTAHRSRDKRRIFWSNSDDTQWLTAGASWEIAKIFMDRLGPRKLDVVNAQTTDISGLLNVLEWSPRGPSGIFNTGVDLSKLVDARRARNTWAHAPQLHVCDVDKANAFASFTSLLQDPELRHDKDAKDAINELQQLLNDGLAVIEDKELELLVELRHQLAQDVVSLKSDMTDWKDQIDANLEQVQNLKKSLDEFVKKNELEKRMHEVGKQISSTNIRLEKLEENASSEPEQFVCDGKSTLKFNPVCDRMNEEFVGREWLFRQIDSWLKKDLGPRESRAFSIRGGPGTGKSSIARELVHRQEGEKLVGYHYFQKDNPRTCDLESLVDSLSNMLSKSLPEYATLVERLSLQDVNKFRDHPIKLFDYLITTPLQQLEVNTKHFFLIDALDEGGAMIASCFARLSAVLPPRLRIIFTATHNAPALFNLFPNSTCADLDSSTTIEEDIRTFVTLKHKKLQSESQDYIPPIFENNTQAAIEKIIQASKNCFLYAKLVMEHIFSGHNTNDLPPKLCEIYCLEFRRRFPDVDFFKQKIAPVLEVLFAIEHVNAKIYKDTRAGNSRRLSLKLLKDEFETSKTVLKAVVENGLLSGITTEDLNKALEMLSVYLVKNSRGMFYFSHSSVRMWLQEEKSDFFCDVINGHFIMAMVYLKTLKTLSSPLEDNKSFFVRYLLHSSYLRERRNASVNFLISELDIKAIDLLHAVLCHAISEYWAMKVLDETDALDDMSLEKKAEYICFAIENNCAGFASKLLSSAHWIFSFEVLYTLKNSKTIRKTAHYVQEKDSLPQLLFSVLCGGYIFHEMIQFCVENGVTADVRVPNFFKNTEHFDLRICWNEEVQEYFRKLKSGEKNVITLESLKENPSFPKEAQMDNFTLELIQKPLCEVERLVKEGECYVCFTYGWHVMALTKYVQRSLDTVDFLLKHGAGVNNRGHLGKTALMMACAEMQDRDLVSLLLDRGAKVNQQDFYGSTALHHALERKQNSKDRANRAMQVRVIEILLEHEADPHLKNSRGISAIDVAEQAGGIVLEKLTGKRRRRGGLETDHDTSL